MSRLIPVPATPDFDKRLLEEIDRENFRQEVRALRLQGQLALAAATPKPKPRRRSSGQRPSVRLSNYASLIAKAARHAGTDIRKFCTLLDKDRVPVPASWGTSTWTAAYNTPKLQTRIRSVKHRYSQPA
jgi:hypothetical protein